MLTKLVTRVLTTWLNDDGTQTVLVDAQELRESQSLATLRTDPELFLAGLVLHKDNTGKPRTLELRLDNWIHIPDDQPITLLFGFEQ